MTSPELIKWLKSHPLISVRGLESKTGIPQDVLRKAMEGRQKLSDKHIPKIVKELKRYGLIASEKE